MVDLRETLATLEDRLHYELHNLKIMIQSLMPNSFHQQSRYENHQRDYYDSRDGFRVPDFQSRPSYNRQIPPPPVGRRENDVKESSYNEASSGRSRNFSTKPTKLTTTTEATTTKSFTKAPEVFNVRRNNLKSLETGKKRSDDALPDSTTTAKPLDEYPKNEFVYYWKLENFPKVFQHAKKNELYSHVFTVKGLFLRISAQLNHYDSDNLLLDIEHLANVDNSEKLEVEISDGLVFKEIAEEKLFQYSFSIMDQNRPNHDMISPVYWNTENENYLIPDSVHLLANYVKNESLLIKLIITF
jgi:hypothetical protein